MPETTGPKQGSQWSKGTSGNPKGRPKGSKHAALVALDAIGSRAAEGVLKKVIEAAKDDDIRAAEILLRRVWPERKGRTVEFDLPGISTIGDIPKALSAVIAAMAAGQITPDEASAIAGVFEFKRRAIETEDFDRRLKVLERAADEGSKR
jgi:Family of unknown function (DUF5681)